MAATCSGSVGERIPKCAAHVVFREVERHVGHSVRCVRETTGNVAGYVVDTIVLRCEDCGEALLEGTQRIRKASQR